MLDFCRSHGIGMIFVQIHYDRSEEGDYKLADREDWNDLLLMANALDIRVEALDGSGNMAFAGNHSDVIARLYALLEFNLLQPANAKFSGVHYDIEPYSTHRWKSGEKQEVAGELLELHWVSLKDAHGLELPNITRMVLGEVERRLREGQSPEDPGPFVYFKHGKPVIDSI